jgi:hypothetical protein
MSNTSLHVTAPYPFAGAAPGLNKTFAQSATSPLVDPRTEEHVGQTLLDFWSDPIYEALEDKTLSGGKYPGFPILITAHGDSEGDTVVGPGFSLSAGISKPISEVVLPLDTECEESECTDRLAQFDIIVKSMKHGESGIDEFWRKTNTSQEKVIIAYSSVTVKSLRPTNASDFSRGVASSEYLVYSLAFAETESVIFEPFKQMQENVDRQINVSIGILSAVITAAACIVIYVSHRITASITEPMLYLLDLIRSINR